MQISRRLNNLLAISDPISRYARPDMCARMRKAVRQAWRQGLYNYVRLCCVARACRVANWPWRYKTALDF